MMESEKIKESWKTMEQKKNNKVRKSMEQEIKGVGVWNRIYLRKKRIKIGKKSGVSWEKIGVTWKKSGVMYKKAE